MGNGVLVGVISSDVECPLVILWGTPTGDRHTDISVVPHPLCPLGTLLKGVEALLYPCFGGHVFLFCHFLKKNRLIKMYLVFAQ